MWTNCYILLWQQNKTYIVAEIDIIRWKLYENLENIFMLHQVTFSDQYFIAVNSDMCIHTNKNHYDIDMNRFSASNIHR